MGLGELVKSLSSKTSDFVKREKRYVTACALVSCTFALDAVSTATVLTLHPTFYRFKETNPFTDYLMRSLGANTGLVVESIITVGLALPLAYSFNKLMRREWRPNEYISKKLFQNRLQLRNWALPEKLTKDLGTKFLYLLSFSSLYGCYNNAYIYNLFSGTFK